MKRLSIPTSAPSTATPGASPPGARSAAIRGGLLAQSLALFHGSTLNGSSGQRLVFCEGTGIEARIGGGWSGHYRDRPLYAFVDAAHLAQDGGCSRNRIEAGYGQDISRHLFIGQQIWFEEGEISGRSVKTETQLGVHFGPADVSLGYREEIGGAFNENAVLIAVVMRR